MVKRMAPSLMLVSVCVLGNGRGRLCQTGFWFLASEFRLKDIGPAVTVKYNGILPDLFREGQGIVAQGTLVDATTIDAFEVLAKHDENYMPQEIEEAMQKAIRSNMTMKLIPLKSRNKCNDCWTWTFALILALGFSLLLSVIPMYGASVNNRTLMGMARPMSWGMF